jgi:hypothetical protein
MKTLALILVLSGMAVSAARAQTFSFLATPIAIPDGSSAGITINTGPVSGTNATMNTVAVTMDWTSPTGGPGHTFIRDIIATLTYTPSFGAPVSLSLMNRIGTNVASVSADLRGSYTFANGGGNIWTAAVGGAIPPGTYAATGAGSSTPLNMNAAFAGLPSTGTWSLFISDAVTPDLGFVASASVRITTIPTPATAALLGLGGLVAARRRRA